MKRDFVILSLIVFNLPLIAQNWSEPLNISTMNGVNQNPGFTIDQEGNFHCVWAHVVNNNFSNIYYSKSEDNGATWISPVNISLNPDKRLFNPNIVMDSEGKIYVTYDRMDGEIYGKILMKVFDGVGWSPADTISGTMLNCFGNQLVMDHNDRIYCFWNHPFQYADYYYKYLENGIWSEIYHPYTQNFKFHKIVVDTQNNLHALASHSNNGGYLDYVIYNYEINQWSSITTISNETTPVDGLDLDIDNNNYPHITWRQKTSGLPNYNEEDSTLYRFFNGNEWSEPELITEDPYSQKIQVINNTPYIIEWEKTSEQGGNIIFYERNDAGIWIGDFVIYINGSLERFLKSGNVLHLLYTAKPNEDNLNIYFMKKIVDTTTSIEEKKFTINSLEIYPNPYFEFANLEFSLLKESHVILRIHSFDGKVIKTIYDGNLPAGYFRKFWDGTDDSGEKVKEGAYLIRLIACKNIISRSVIYLK
jgi:hypothetical protein